MTHLDTRGVPLGPIPARAGIGLRSVHHDALLAERPAVGFIEAHTENYFHDGGAAVRALLRARANYPLSLHGVGLGLGSADGVDREHLARVKRAIARFEPALVSEHACWGHAGGEYFNDLLPLPYTEEAVELLARQVGEAQDFLGVQLLIENVSAYVAFEHSRLTEWEFLAAVAARSGCALLLDVNNIYVSAQNLGLDRVPLHRFAAASAACARSTSPGHARNGERAHRRSWLAGVRAGVGAVRARHRALRRVADAGRVGHTTFRRWRRWSPRRGAPSAFSGRFMASLRELQHSFAASLRDPGGDLRRCCRPRISPSIATTRSITFRTALELTFPGGAPARRRRLLPPALRALSRSAFRRAAATCTGPGATSRFPRRPSRAAVTTPGSPISRASSGRVPNAWSRASRLRSASKRSANFHPTHSSTWFSDCSPRCNCIASAFPVFTVWLANQVDNAPPVDQSTRQ